MKQITTFSGKMYLIEDEKIVKLKELMETKGIIELENGTLLNSGAIESVGEVETEPYFMGNKMNKSMTKVFVQGDWKQFCGDRSEIEQRPILTNNKLLQ